MLSPERDIQKTSPGGSLTIGHGSTDLRLDTSTELKKLTNRYTNLRTKGKMCLYLLYKYFVLQRSIFNHHVVLQSGFYIKCNFQKKNSCVVETVCFTDLIQKL